MIATSRSTPSTISAASAFRDPLLEQRVDDRVREPAGEDAVDHALDLGGGEHVVDDALQSRPQARADRRALAGHRLHARQVRGDAERQASQSDRDGADGERRVGEFRGRVHAGDRRGRRDDVSSSGRDDVGADGRARLPAAGPARRADRHPRGAGRRRLPRCSSTSSRTGCGRTTRSGTGGRAAGRRCRRGARGTPAAARRRRPSAAGGEAALHVRPHEAATESPSARFRGALQGPEALPPLYELSAYCRRVGKLERAGERSASVSGKTTARRSLAVPAAVRNRRIV